MTKREIYEFGEFTLDAPERRLSRGSQSIPLAPKEHDLLLALVRNAGRLVTKSELLEQVWPASFVEEGILSVHISTLRKLLGDRDSASRFIETVPRAGYRFVGPVVRVPEVALSGMDAATQARMYELYGRGRSLLLASSIHELPKAMEAFRAAAELDPGYAPAHAGMAMTWCSQAAFRLIPPTQAYAEAKSAALRAIAMDADCADAQVALGTVLFFSEWNWAAAEKSLKRALQLNPNHSEAYVVYGQLLEALGNLEEGLETKLKALQRDPHSPLVHLQISMSYWHQRRYDDAIDWANKTLQIDPLHPHAREHLAAAYWKKGDADRFFQENLKHAELHGATKEMLEDLKQCFASEGRFGMVKRVLDGASKNPQAFPAVQLALFHGETGDLDAAFQHLDRAIDSHDPSLVHLGVAPQWDGLRGDPRFNQSLLRIGLRK
jgi:DNA-binding winged helix-turn-helix (wHTH) protein/predicted Zn-dependent protease